VVAPNTTPEHRTDLAPCAWDALPSRAPAGARWHHGDDLRQRHASATQTFGHTGGLPARDPRMRVPLVLRPAERSPAAWLSPRPQADPTTSGRGRSCHPREVCRSRRARQESHERSRRRPGKVSPSGVVKPGEHSSQQLMTSPIVNPMISRRAAGAESRSLVRASSARSLLVRPREVGPDPVAADSPSTLRRTVRCW
jgi:hypothetical protein